MARKHLEVDVLWRSCLEAGHRRLWRNVPMPPNTGRTWLPNILRASVKFWVNDTDVPVISLVRPTILDKSLGTNVHLRLFTNTRNKESRDRFNQREPNPSPHPTYNVENTYPQLFLTFNIVLGGGGGNCNVVLKYGNAFRRSAQIFDNYGFCITVPRYFVQDCRSE